MTAQSANNIVTITPNTTAHVVVTANGNSTVYNGLAQSVSGYTATGILSGDSATALEGITASGATATNAGTYANNITNKNSNYANVTINEGNLVINPATAKLAATKTYDSYTGLNDSQLTITGVNGENLTYLGAANANSPNVAANGNNFVTSGITLFNGVGSNAGLASNYVLPNMSAQSTNNIVTITPVTTPIIVTGTSNSTIYDGLNQSATGYTITGLVGQDDATPNNLAGITSSNPAAKNAGTYANVVSGANSNYASIQFVNGALSIAKASLVITPQSDAKYVTYSDVVGYAGVTVEGLVNGETASSIGIANAVSITRSNASNNFAGVYNGVLVPSGPASTANYNISYVNGNYTIVPANQLLVTTNGVTTTYGTSAKPTITSVQYLNETSHLIDYLTLGSTSVNSAGVTIYNYVDSVGGNVSFSIAPANTTLSTSGNINVGIYNLGYGNYIKNDPNLISNTINVEGSYTVNSKALIVSTNELNTVYNGANQSQAAAAVSGLVNRDVVNISGVAAAKNVGNYASNLSISGPDSANYQVSYIDQTLSITPAIAKISATKVYDASTAINSTQITVAGINGETLNYSGNAFANNENVLANGTNFVVNSIALTNGSGSNAGLASNYILPNMESNSANNNVTITPNPSKVVITANSGTGVYNGQTQSVQGYVATGLIGSDALTPNWVSGITASGASGINAGSYANNLSGTNNNYSNMTLLNGALTIKPATATITAAKEYDSTTSLSANQISITGVNGETLSYVGNAVAGNANVAANGFNFVTNSITLTNGNGENAGLASNYVLPNMTTFSANNNVTITPNSSPVIIAANSLNSVYNAQTQTVAGYVATGLVGNDALTPNSLVGITASGVSGINVGTYSNNLSGTNSNYSNITLINGALTIAPAIAKITATKVYDSTSSLTPSQITIIGVNGETLSYTGNASAVDTNVAANGFNFVTNSIALTDGSGAHAGVASNYVLPNMMANSANNNVTITPNSSQVIITANSATGVYSGFNQSIQGYIATGLIGVDALSPTALNGIVASGATATNAGTYANSLTGTNSNYSNVIFQNGTLKITPAVATLSAVKVYDSTTALNASQITIAGVNGETLSYTGEATASNANVAANGNNYVTNSITLANGSGANSGLASNYVLPNMTANSANNNVLISPNLTPIVITANSANVAYNGQNQTIQGYTVKGLVGNDAQNNSYLNGFNASGATGLNIGTYLNTVTGENSNYSNVTLVAGALTITYSNFDRPIIPSSYTPESNPKHAAILAPFNNHAAPQSGADSSSTDTSNAVGGSDAGAQNESTCLIKNHHKKIIINTNLLFDAGKAWIKPQYFGALNSIASGISINKFSQIVIVSSGDADSEKSAQTNLAERRGQALQKYLTLHHVAKNAIKLFNESEKENLKEAFQIHTECGDKIFMDKNKTSR